VGLTNEKVLELLASAPSRAKMQRPKLKADYARNILDVVEALRRSTRDGSRLKTI
jgi:hypothetical protein